MPRILRIKEVMEVTGLPRSSIYYNMKEGLFPKQVQLTKKSVGWREEDIQKFLDGLTSL